VSTRRDPDDRGEPTADALTVLSAISLDFGFDGRGIFTANKSGHLLNSGQESFRVILTESLIEYGDQAEALSVRCD